MKLETSTELLERLRAKHGSSWYGLGRLLEVHENTITNWKGGRTIVDRKFAPRIAELLGETPEYVLLCLEHERETSPEVRKIWRRLAALVTHSAASILFGTVVLLGLAVLPAQRVAAGVPEEAPAALYIKSNCRTVRHIPHCFPQGLRYIPFATVSPALVFREKQQLEPSRWGCMNRTTWEIFQGATLSLARSGALKDRLTAAYRNHLACVDETELPRELREDFRSFNHAITRERPLLRGEDAVRATIRKMSNGEAEAAATSVVKMFCALQRGAGPSRSAPTVTIVPLYMAAEPLAAEA